MPDSHNSDSSTNSTLAQLLEIDSQLSAQETQLLSQLKSIQEKRNSLQVVIGLFTEADKAHVASPIEETTSTPQAQTQKASKTVDESKAVVEPEPQEVPLAPPTDASSTVNKTTTSIKKKSQARKNQLKRNTKPVVGWQQYLREKFRNSSLPQAISSVLHSQAGRVWDIPAVVETIFVEEIPQEVKKKVRHQITNLLAQGARENKWYRGQQGSYTLSKDAAESQNR